MSSPHEWDAETAPAQHVTTPVLLHETHLYIPSRDPVEVDRMAQEFLTRSGQEGGPDVVVPHGTAELNPADFEIIPASPHSLTAGDYALRRAQEGPGLQGTLLEVGRAERLADEHHAQATQAQAWANVARDEDQPDVAHEMEAAAGWHERHSAAFRSEAEQLRHEAANAYSTTVAGPPSDPKSAPAQQGQQSRPQPQKQQQQNARPTR